MDSSDRYNRNERKGSSVNDEVQKLLRKNGRITPQEFVRLRNQLKDDELVSKIQAVYAEKQGNIVKKAKKFAQIIREKYSQTSTPFHILLEKAYKYKTKYSLSDDEFAEFQRIYEQELIGLKSTEVIQPETNLMKVLGGISLDVHGFQMKLNPDDYKYLQEILKIYSSNRPVHAQILLQAMQYVDCAVETLTGRYNPDLHNVNEHVHPVIAALFIPKIKVVEDFFLFANIAGVVKARYNQELPQSRPDFELLHALTNDPNDVVCDNTSPVKDLLNRAQLQTELWQAVLNLRNGQYYNSSFRNFISAVDMCRLNRQDTPDLLYGRFDGVVIKRLLSAFSFRPTVVATSPSFVQNVSVNPYLLNVRPQVLYVPMINMRIPPQSIDNSEIRLESAIEQQQFFLEPSGVIAPRNTSLIWSRGVLVFYVDRRANSVTFNDHLTQFSMANLPSTVAIAGYEKLNTRCVEFEPSMKVRDETYELRSVVVSELNTTIAENKSLVIGSSALIRRPADPANNIMDDQFYCYDPYGPIKARTGEKFDVPQAPVTAIGWTDPNFIELSFKKLASERGTVFIYASSGNTDASKELIVN